MSTKKRRISKKCEEKEFDLDSFRVEVTNLIHVTILERFIARSFSFWRKRKTKERVKEIIYITKDERIGKDHPLYKCLYEIRKESILSIKKIHRKYLGKSALSYEGYALAIVFKFFNQDTPLEKRNKEAKSLKEMNVMKQEYRFVTMSDTTLPSDVILVIFRYLRRNENVFFSVGKVCKTFYFLLLYTWNGLRVSKTMQVESIPLLVLQNVQILSVIRTTIVQKNYLWRNCNRNLLELHISGNTQEIRSTLRNIVNHVKSRKVHPFSKIRHLNFDLLAFASCENMTLNYEEIFPSLKSVTGIESLFNIKRLKNCSKIDSLGFTLRVGERMPRNNGGRFTIDSRFQCIRQNINPRNVKTLILSKLEVMEFNFDECKKFLNFFSSVEVLEISYKEGFSNRRLKRQLKTFDFAMFNSLKKLRSLTLKNVFRGYGYSGSSHHLVPVRYNNFRGFGKRIEYIKIISIPVFNVRKDLWNSSSPQYNLDLFLENMISEFLCVAVLNLRKFSGILPLRANRIRNVNYTMLLKCRKWRELMMDLFDFVNKELMASTKMEHFELILKDSDRHDLDAKFSLSYHRHLKRIIVAYKEESPYFYKPEEGEKYFKSRSIPFDITHSTATDDEKIVEILKASPLVLKMFFQLFPIKCVKVLTMSGKVDIILFDGTWLEEDKWNLYFEKTMSEYKSNNFFEDFECVDNYMCVIRKSLL